MAKAAALYNPTPSKEVNVQDLVSAVLLLAVISCGLSIMLSPLTGKKMDPFLILRPIARYATRVFRRSLSGLVKTLKQWTRSAWRAAQHPGRPLWLRLPLYGLATLCGAGVVLLAIPADIVGSGKK